MSTADLDRWLSDLIGGKPGRPALYEQALTHGSASTKHYERLEFLGDRVLGLVMAQWLYTRFPDEKEGQLSRRFNQLVAGDTCAVIARQVGVRSHMRLGKQARDDGAMESDNVLGDVAAANNRRPPDYLLVERSGPQHALRFTVAVSIKGVGEARGEGASKQEAETAAATALLASLVG